MPKLWEDTIEAHRRTVREAAVRAAAALVAEQGLASVTMSQIAKRAGIGRATLYKYFPDIESVLAAWHEEHIADHLRRLTDVAEHTDPAERLRAVLRAFASITHQRHDGDLAALLHRGEHVAEAHRRLHAFIGDLVAGAAAAGTVRDDVPAGELATYCLHALTAAGAMTSSAAVHRLVEVTLAGLRPAPAEPHRQPGQAAPGDLP
ncbi:TetR/AcrR family transcriptional regulator [Actinoallomurus iriomotensis]|uniref:TetR/AcrR family transcriptional regulator n=1 Tax=Actinoallomurus iriomotensis TaxID=478107 RepID=UPI0025521923|nr:TetR/AcrR family transcriptional regulator [Actinoallomurus iriomotensis]